MLYGKKLKVWWPQWSGKKASDERTLDLCFSTGFRFGKGGIWLWFFVMGSGFFIYKSFLLIGAFCSGNGISPITK